MMERLLKKLIETNGISVKEVSNDVFRCFNTTKMPITVVTVEGPPSTSWEVGIGGSIELAIKGASEAMEDTG